MGRGDTLVNGTVGAVVSTILYFIPVVHVIAPIGGGFVAGYLQKQGIGGGMKAGFVKGFVMVIPAILLGAVAGNVLASIPLIGDLLAGSLTILVVVVVVHSIALGLMGGLVGGLVAGSPPPKTETKTGTKSERDTPASESTDGTRASSDASTQTRTPQRRTGREKARSPSLCPNCESPVAEGNKFCQRCGSRLSEEGRPGEERADRMEDRSNRGVQREADTDERGRPRDEARGERNQYDRQGNRDRTDDEDRSDPSSSVDDAPTSSRVARAAESIAERRRLNSAVAKDLCETLSDHSADDDDLESSLEDAVERLEETAAVTAAVEELDGATSGDRLESTRRDLAGRNAPIADAVESVLDRLQSLERRASEAESAVPEVERELERTERRYRDLADAAGSVCREVERNDVVAFEGDDVTERTAELADALRADELSLQDPETSISRVAAEVDRTVRPGTQRSRELLETLADPGGDVARVLETTVETLDDGIELQESVADIEPADVRWRLESLDDELRREEGDVYRHLADRIREFEAMLDRTEEIDPVRLYAIYQECTFYDRTLLPRLSRSLGSDASADVGSLLTDVEGRIDAIEREYVAVRADHNHSIPRHFLSVAKDLCDQARRTEQREPDRAAGMLDGANELVTGIERLYERNEYSVMLRRLRG